MLYSIVSFASKTRYPSRQSVVPASFRLGGIAVVRVRTQPYGITLLAIHKDQTDEWLDACQVLGCKLPRISGPLFMTGLLSRVSVSIRSCEFGKSSCQGLNKAMNSLRTFFPWIRFSALIRSFGKCAPSLHCPSGMWIAGAFNSRSRIGVSGMVPPSRT